MSRSRVRWSAAVLSAACILGLTVALSGEASAAASPFHAAAQPAGSLAVKLHPTEVVRTGTPKLVTFGVPMPRGSITAANLRTVRVLKGSTEIPAYVDQMTPWRHATNAALDGASVRVIRVQITYTFAVASPNSETITVSWGGANRTANVTQLVDARTAWHRVTDGTTATGGPTFGSADNVFEPDVYAVLPKAWLSASGLKTPMTPMDDSIGPNRVPPASVASSYPGYRESDQAQVNFFYTIINDDDRLTGPVTTKNTNPFTVEDGPWLYDRGTAIYLGYLRTGYLRFLREAVRNTEFYRTKLWTAADCGGGRCVGSFKLKNPDASAGWHDQKYSYNEPLALTHWLTGDTRAPSHIEDVAKVYDDYNSRVNTTVYTERHVGLKLMANVLAYEVTGKAVYRDKMLAVLADLRQGQTNPFGGGPVDGGIWHSLAAHEGGAPGGDQPITSPWMSALIADAAARLYLVSENQTAAQLLIGLGNHECGVGSYWSTIRNGANPLAEYTNQPVFLPHYLATRDGLGFTGEFDPWANMEHAPEVAAVAAWGAYFAGLTGDAAKQNSLRRCANDLYTTWSHVITSWTRPAAPGNNQDAYRVDPYRKYGWWFKNSSGFAWAMASGTGSAPPPDRPPSQTQSPSPTQTPPPGTPACGTSRPESIYNRTFPASSNFTLIADATPQAGADTGVGIGGSPPLNESNSFSTATTVRFNTANSRIEARSGATYPATTIAWTPGQRYRVKFIVNVAAHTYSASVTAPGGQEQVVGTGLAFRSNYAGATSLNNLRGSADGASIQVCAVSLPS